MRLSARLARNVAAHENLTSVGPDPAFATPSLAYRADRFLSAVEVFVNDAPVTRGITPSAGVDVYPGERPDYGDLKFTKPLRKGDKVTIRKVFPISSKKG